MRPFRRIEDKHGVDDPDYEAPSPGREPEVAEDKDDKPRYEINPIGLALVCVGAAGMAVAAFLPYVESAGVFAQIKENTLIQHEGWFLLVCALGAVLAGYRSYHSGRRGFATIVWGLLGLALAIKVGNDKALRTLYPIGSNGEADASQPGTVASVGIAIYVAGAAGLVTAFGGLQMRKSPLAIEERDEATMRCPECAETVLAAAHVCKHCGHRFAPPSAT
jgi:ribosomal protein L37AE/L43A